MKKIWKEIKNVALWIGGIFLFIFSMRYIQGIIAPTTQADEWEPVPGAPNLIKLKKNNKKIRLPKGVKARDIKKVETINQEVVRIEKMYDPVNRRGFVGPESIDMGL